MPKKSKKSVSRAGRRRNRNESIREPILGYYLIVTDAEETEKNYFNGLKESIPIEMRDRLVVKVMRSKTTYSLVDYAVELCEAEAQKRIPWIVFDRDEVKDFDGIIRDAVSNDISVGWSNPCFEIWLYAYYGEMPNIPNSDTCWRRFAVRFEKETEHSYDKNDSRIYNRIESSGSFETAYKLAEMKLAEAESDGKQPSQSCPACTVHRLVKEIKDKINN